MTIYELAQKLLNDMFCGDAERASMYLDELRAALIDSHNLGLEIAAHRLETANDETSRQCITDAIRAMKLESVPISVTS